MLNTNDVIVSLAKSMDEANRDLRGDSPDKFNRYFLNLVQKEIEIGRLSAHNCRYFNPGSKTYTHTTKVPISVFENLSEDFLHQLELMGIYMYANEVGSATLRIVFKF